MQTRFYTALHRHLLASVWPPIMRSRFGSMIPAVIASPFILHISPNERMNIPASSNRTYGNRPLWMGDRRTWSIICQLRIFCSNLVLFPEQGLNRNKKKCRKKARQKTQTLFLFSRGEMQTFQHSKKGWKSPLNHVRWCWKKGWNSWETLFFYQSDTRFLTITGFIGESEDGHEVDRGERESLCVCVR